LSPAFVLGTSIAAIGVGVAPVAPGMGWCRVDPARARGQSMIPKKPGPDLIRLGTGFRKKPALGLDPRDHAPSIT